MINEVLGLGNKIEKLKEIVDKSNKIVFFTGAGVSVASGIPDFRSMVDYLMKYLKMAILLNIY